MSTQEAAVTRHSRQNGVGNSKANGALDISEDGDYVSEERYWADYYQQTECPYEWNNGHLEQKPMSDYAQFLLYAWFLNLLKDFLHVNPMGRLVGLELGFRMALPQKTVVRIPDLAIVLDRNPIPLLDKDRSYRGTYDLCVESLSDSSQKEIDRDVIHKKQEYAAAGVQEYYILDVRNQATQFYRLSPGGIYRPISAPDGIIRSNVLTGFQFRLHDLYRRPEPPTMIDDVVYRDYVSPHLRAERVRAEQAEERAAQAEERAEQAEQDRERYAAILRQLGVDL